MPSNALARALAEPPGLRALPDRVADLLRHLDAPPRLAAHLRLVHDVAYTLTAAVARSFPAATFDREKVLFGAAVHDIGKTRYPAELSAPGSHHERGGHELLIALGVEEPLARFAWTHAAWHDPTTRFEDHLVSLADKVWKAKRVEDLEHLVVDHLATTCDRTTWEVFMDLDDILASLAANADDRLAIQAAHPL